MKTNYSRLYTLAGALLFSLASIGQITVTQWNFNGGTSSTVPGGTFSPSPSAGSGTAELVGGATPVSPTTDFSSGASSGGSSDPVVTTPNTNFAWGTTTYAALGTENKQRGVQFNVSTANFAGITFMFDQRLSNTTSNTWVVQYTTNRLAPSPVWVDAQTFTFTPAPTGTGDTWYNQRSVDLSAVTALNNNDLAAFRIVEAFDPVLNDYTAATSTSTYGTGGTSRFDMVTVKAATLLATPHNVSQDNAFVMSPNPAGRQIVYLNKPHGVQVFDITGKLVYQASNVSAIDARGFSSGVYIVRIDTGASRKLIVQ